MSKYITTLILALGLSMAFAHPAGNLKANYNSKTQILEVSYAHKVKDALDHYIAKMEISVNGKQVITHTLSLQESLEGGTLLYKLPALKATDKITVSSECNKGGKKSTSISLK